MKRLQLGPCVAALTAALWCALLMWPLVNPFTMDVVFRHDWAQHTLGWLFFRNAGLDIPLGNLPNFLHPLGTTVGYMDGIPLMALALRPFSAILPVEFQYLGLWILGSSMSIALASAWLVGKVTPYWEHQALGGALTAMAPTFASRLVHPALCAHMLVVAALALVVAAPSGRMNAHRSLICSVVLVLIAAAVHPYHPLMTLPIALGVPLQLYKRVGIWRSLLASVVMFGGAAGMLKLLGYGGGMIDSVGGFGHYSANLNTLWNSLGRSRILPGLPQGDGQYEGYAYLGAGVLLLVVLTISMLVIPVLRRRIFQLPWRRAVWPTLAALACAMFAFATPLRWGTEEVVTIEFYKRFEETAGIFRSSGRFIWPLAYLVVLGTLVVAAKALRDNRWWLSGVLVVALAVQAYDIDTANAWQSVDGHREKPFTAAEWSLGDRGYRHLVVYPAEVKFNCDGPQAYREQLITELAYLAYRHRWTFNSGYAARVRTGTREACDAMNDRVAAADLDPKSIYVVTRHKEWNRLRRSGKAICGTLEGMRVCVKTSRKRLATWLLAHKY